MTQRTLAFLGGLLWAGVALAGSVPEESLRWTDLGARIEGRKVALVLPDGTEVQGKVRGVESGGLRLDVSKTSNKKAQPKGVHLIPRQSVSYLRVTEYRKLGRVLITAGAFASAAGIAAASLRSGGIGEGVGVIAIPAAAAAGTVGIGIGVCK